MKKTAFVLAFCLFTLCLSAQNSPVTDWSSYSYPQILELYGQPQVFETVYGPAVEFNGSTDAVFVDSVPVKGMEEFTLEVIFNQYSDAAFEQRFLHIGTMEERILFETRVKPDGTWYFDAHVNLGKEGKVTLIDENLTHPADKWYNVTLVARKDGMTTYVNGIRQCSTDFGYKPLISGGVTSVGVRQNFKNWFRGAIIRVRVTPKALGPDEFLKDYEKLNGK